VWRFLNDTWWLCSLRMMCIYQRMSLMAQFKQAWAVFGQSCRNCRSYLWCSSLLASEMLLSFHWCMCHVVLVFAIFVFCLVEKLICMNNFHKGYSVDCTNVKFLMFEWKLNKMFLLWGSCNASLLSCIFYSQKIWSQSCCQIWQRRGFCLMVWITNSLQKIWYIFLYIIVIN